MSQNRLHEKTDSSEDKTEAPEEKRDAYAELTDAVNKVTRVRYRLKREETFSAALFVIMGIILVCAIFIGIGDNDTSTIVFAAIIIAAVVAGVAIFIVSKVKSHTPYYCYYARTENGVFCMSVIGDNATVFAYGTAYRIEGERFYTLDEQGYREWLDGEGAGLYSALCCSQGDVAYEDGVYVVAAPHGGSHEFVIRDGVIEQIKSAQPFETEDVDPKTGEKRVKHRVYTKLDPTEDFTWEVPAFVTEAFEAAGEQLPDMSAL